MISALHDAVRTWLADDPDEHDRAELEGLVAGERWEDLADRFGQPLRFGTAGIRGPLRAGPSGVNTATVARTAAGLAAFLADAPAASGDGPPSVVVGFDGRHRSRSFARTCAEVLAGGGCRVTLLAAPAPTPLLAFAVRHLDTAAGVMITASHNPATDNGLKLYLGGLAGSADAGAQIAPPTDVAVEGAIGRVRSVRDLLRGEPQIVPVPTLSEAYLDALFDASTEPTRPPGSRGLRIAYTPLHGVGLPLVTAALSRAGFPDPGIVPEQAEPDPDFPTVPFPNPEVDGALDLLRRLVTESGADLGLASDPDADRCAVVVGDRVLTGDEIGCLLADRLLRTRPGPVATSFVSSSLLPKMAERAGVPCAVTRTGFKWLMRADPDLTFAYEEALGYAVAPHVVRDKDGISAALLLAEFADELRRSGETLRNRLDALAVEFGLHVTRGVAVRRSRAEEAQQRMSELVARPPRRLAGVEVVAAGPLRADGVDLPVREGLALHLDGGRVLIRPSGTEPTLKAYLELVRPVGGADPDQVRSAALRRLDELAADVHRTLRGEADSPGQASN